MVVTSTILPSLTPTPLVDFPVIAFLCAEAEG
jgi:hypothetical protein